MSNTTCSFWLPCNNAVLEGKKYCAMHSRYRQGDLCEHPDGCEFGPDGQPAPPLSKGLCSTHHMRWTNTGEIGPGGRLIAEPGGTCIHPKGCPRHAKRRGWCDMHAARLDATGDPGPVGRVKARNGEGNLTNKGYVRLTVDGRRTWEHSVVMEQKLGRRLRPFENVHHLNRIRHDNRPENLELWCIPQPAGQRPRDLAEWVLDAYPGLVEAIQAERSQLRLVIND